MDKFSGDESIPVIDLKDIGLKDNNSEGKCKSSNEIKLAKELVHALSTVGFVYLKNHGIADDSINDAFQSSVDFFRQSASTKALLLREKLSRHGYSGCEMEAVNPDRKVGDFKECFDITNQGSACPSTPSSFKPSMTNLVNDSKRLCYSLLRLLGIGLGLKEVDFFVENHDLNSLENTSMMRTLFYPKISAKDLKKDQVQLGEHTDYGTLTLLFQHRVGGLEVQTVRGGKYVPAPPIPDTVLVNIGDLMERWTDGRLRATYHRVITPLKKERQSIAFFLHPRDDLVIKTLELESENHQEESEEGFQEIKHLPPIKAKDYFDQRFYVTFREDEQMNIE